MSDEIVTVDGFEKFDPVRVQKLSTLKKKAESLMEKFRVEENPDKQMVALAHDFNKLCELLLLADRHIPSSNLERVEAEKVPVLLRQVRKSWLDYQGMYGVEID